MNIAARVAKMERIAGMGSVIGRIFQLVGGQGTDGEAETFLADHGFILERNDMIICRPIHRPGARGPELVPVDLEFVIKVNTTHEDALAELG